MMPAVVRGSTVIPWLSTTRTPMVPTRPVVPKSTTASKLRRGEAVDHGLILRRRSAIEHSIERIAYRASLVEPDSMPRRAEPLLELGPLQLMGVAGVRR